MNYELFRNITIGIIIICLLAIIFKRQIKNLFTEGFDTTSGGTTTTSGGTTTTSGGTTTTTSGGTTTTSGGITTTTSGGTTTTTSGGTTTTSGGTTATTSGGTTTSQGQSTDTQIKPKKKKTRKLPKPTNNPDVVDIKYTYRVAGYIPVLDIILTRLILFKVWEADWANLNTTQLAALNSIPNETLLSSNTTKQSETFVDIEKLGMNTNKRSLYPETYAGDFEAFFTAEIGNIPRLNVFILNNTRINLSMDIVFTNFRKPEWVTKMAQYYKDPTTLTQSVEDYVSELKGELPQQREDNTSNTVVANEISELRTITMPIKLREKIERLQLTQLLINLVPGREPTSVSQLAPMFNELTQGLLTFISSYYPTLNMLYIRVDDEDTRVLLGLTKDGVYTTDDLLTPTLVNDARAKGSWSLANMLGYPDPNGITYMTKLLFNDNRSRNKIEMLLEEHSRQIELLARRAILQNSAFGVTIPDNIIWKDGIETVTDNIYTYYFSLLKETQPAICRIDKNRAECFDNIKRDKVFQKLNEEGHLNKIYPDLDNLKEIAASLTSEYETAITDGLPEPDVKKIKFRLDDINKRIGYLTVSMPYVIYLPIYDFQYIKIIPKRNRGSIFKPDPQVNFN